MTTSCHDAGRRTVIAAIASLPLGCAAATPDPASGAPPPERGGSRTLVAYFSRSGNTRVIAGLIHRSQPSDLFEIQAAAAYPEDYLQTVAQARRERDEGAEPALHSRIPGVAAYDTVYLGFPIWGETAPPIIRTLLSQHDLRGKTLIPFITHGGFGVGSSLRVLAQRAPGADIQQAFVMEADQERRTMETVNRWLKESE